MKSKGTELKSLGLFVVYMDGQEQKQIQFDDWAYSAAINRAMDLSGKVAERTDKGWYVLFDSKEFKPVENENSIIQ